MKIRLMSDLHLEFFAKRDYKKFGIVSTDADREETVLVLAGDICTISSSMHERYEHFLQTVSKQFHSVILVPGNHEYYMNVVETVLDALRLLGTQIDNLYVMENDWVEINGIEFIGATLWTDLKKRDPLVMAYAQMDMNDYRCIQRRTEIPEYCRPLKPDDTVNFHRRSVAFIQERLEKTTCEKTVVVTHHLPSYDLVSDFRKNNHPLNHAYFSDLDWLIHDYKPVYWLCGHSHDSMDVMIGETRCVLNPHGYLNYEVNKNFDINMELEL